MLRLCNRDNSSHATFNIIMFPNETCGCFSLCSRSAWFSHGGDGGDGTSGALFKVIKIIHYF